jgi:hypothetical protein
MWFYVLLAAIAFYFLFRVTEMFTNASYFTCKRCRLKNATIAQEKCDPICREQNGTFTGKYKSVNIVDGLCECTGENLKSQNQEKEQTGQTKTLDKNDKKNLSKSFFAFTKTRKSKKN